MCLVLFVIGACFFLRGHLASSLGTRWPAWEYMLKEGFINPFIGCGLGMFSQDVSMMFGNSLIQDSYSDYFRLIYEFGPTMFLILAVSAFLYYKRLFLQARKYFTPKILLASVTAILICMLQRDVLTVVRLAIPSVIILALFEASCLDSITKEACNDKSQI